MSIAIAENGYRFSRSSISKLDGVHPALVMVVGLALTLSEVDFGITSGLRTVETQRSLLEAGKTTTMNSRHITGHAIDFAAYPGGKLSWDWKYYAQIAVAMKQAAQLLGISIEWGGDWITFKDGPHIQLSRSQYPG